MSAHTPGPWVVSVFTDHDGSPSSDQIQVHGVIGNTWEPLCECDWSEIRRLTPLRRMDAMANARLMAASPMLLAALIEANHALCDLPLMNSLVARMRAAIAAATGAAE